MKITQTLITKEKEIFNMKVELGGVGCGINGRGHS